MKATGVVRRIDDLGRIVIPIEIRRSMKIRDGDPLEIFVQKGGEVILKKHSAIKELGGFAQEIARSLHEATGHLAFITDRDAVVFVAGGSEREFTGRPVGQAVIDSMENRATLFFTGENHGHVGSLLEDEGENCRYAAEVISPIIVAGDPAGTVMICSRETDAFGELEEKLAVTAAEFLTRHMEE